MRVTEFRMIDLARNGIEGAQSRAADAANEMSSGLKVAKPSDDLAAWTDAQRVADQQKASGARGGAIGRAGDRLQYADSALGNIGDALAQVRQLSVQAINGTLTAQQRSIISAQITTLSTQIVGAANARDPGGEYLFAGSQGNAPPFSATGVYSGDALSRSVEVAQGQWTPVTVPGTVLTAANGVDVISVVLKLAAALAANDPVTAGGLLAGLDTATTQVLNARGQLGDQMSALKSADDARATFELALAKTRSDDVDADAVAAASSLAQAKNALSSAEAVAQQIVSMTQGGLGR